MGWLGSLFTGSNSTLDHGLDTMGNNASFLTNTGTSDVAASSNFMKTLLSGDSAKQNQLLAPEISAIGQRSQQQKQQLGEFGNRTGGLTASMNKSTDDVHSQINDLVAGLVGGAARSLGSAGAGLIGEGMGAMQAQVGMSQQRMKNGADSLFGSFVGDAAGSGSDFLNAGVGKLEKLLHF